MTERLNATTARDLLDFAAGASGGVVSEAVAEEQLLGAVALHNMLQEQNVAYLADEVGMGKTYVALGAMALLRHFRPELRVMVLAPKENIQNKWIKEWRNFVSRVVKVEDLRVKALGGHPSRALVKVNSLVDLVTEASNDPDRDFFVRLTSFSLPVFGADGTLSRRRDQLLRALPWLPRDLLQAHNKDRYKRNFARAVNCALPDINLLIVDEAHNLKAGWKDGARSSVRNTVVGCALGGRTVDEDASSFKGYRRRVNKVLFLSATPIEYDIRQLWNQLDLFGFGAGWEALRDPKLEHEQHREVVRRLLIRRTAELVSAGTRLTKSEYRREWRAGGIAVHDQPLQVATDRQRLAVALVQKKVAEVLGNGEHNHSFQVGLLASFESFLETVKSTVARGQILEEGAEDEEAGDTTAFHRTAEEIAAAKEDRRDGADIDAINALAKDHRKTFNTEMPHPKMDAIVDELAKSFITGRKALVFVRRVASVDELQRKLEDRYDSLLFARLRDALRTPKLRDQIDKQIEAYCAERSNSRHGMRARDEFRNRAPDETEASSVDSFFAWFFRGDGPPGVRSGASIALDLEKASSAYSTLLEDNYVAAVLDVPPASVLTTMAGLLSTTVETVLERVNAAAQRFLNSKRGAIPSRARMRAVQAGGLDVLRVVKGRIAEHSDVILQAVFTESGMQERATVDFEAERWLEERTLFAELRRRPGLQSLLWPTASAEDFAQQFREREVRRELMSTMIRKGHPIIDVFILIANRLGSISKGARELVEMNLPDLATEILSEWERQSVEGRGEFSSFQELADCASAFHLIVQLNAPDLLDAELSRIPTILGKTLRAQRPVAGMAGQVNGEVVKQFRMPGYPLILVTTDLLKEGEDLHTFCSSVYHYGIAWMPSELEQRVGRIDRVGSQTERRLIDRKDLAEDGDLLQVYYPHLNDTVEVLQLRRVYERLNRFMRTMHEGLGAPQKEKAGVSVSDEGLRHQIDTAAIRTPLRSAFRVTPGMVRGPSRALVATAKQAERMHWRLDAVQGLVTEMGATDVSRRDINSVVGQMRFGSRVQPFVLLLRSVRGRPLLRCVSPVGSVAMEEWDDDLAASMLSRPYARLALETNPRYEAYDVAIEGDILLGDSQFDLVRARSLITNVTEAADDMENELLRRDAVLVDLAAGLNAEINVAR